MPSRARASSETSRAHGCGRSRPGGAIAPETAHALVALDTEARGKEAKAKDGGPAVPQASRREEIRLAWAHAVPWALRGRMEMPLATWAVLGMLIARARFTHSEWRAELSLTELQRRLGGAGAGHGGGGGRAPREGRPRPRHPAPAQSALQRGQYLRPRASGGGQSGLGDALAGGRDAGGKGSRGAVYRPPGSLRSILRTAAGPGEGGTLPYPSRRLSHGRGEAFAGAAGIASLGVEAGARRRPTGNFRRPQTRRESTRFQQSTLLDS